MGPIGVQEMIVIFLIALLLFGPRKLPELGKNLAKAMGEFNRAKNELKNTFDREMQTIERENEALKVAAEQASAEIQNYADLDLAGGTSGAYGAESSTSPSISGASEVASADSTTPSLEHAPENVPGSLYDLTQPEGTVARGSASAAETPAAAESVVADANPLPELQAPAKASGHTENAELSSLA